MIQSNDRLFFASGLLAFLLFFLVIALFSQLLNEAKIQQFALDKHDAMTISLSLENIDFKESKKEAPRQPAKQEPVQEVVEPTPQSQKADIQSLFSNINAKKPKYEQKKEPKKIDQKRLQQLQTRIKPLNKRASSLKQKIDSIALTSGANSALRSKSSGKEINEYIAKIQALIYENFYPPANSEGYSAKVRIWISGFGKLSDYRVLAYSGNQYFNQEVDALKRRLQKMSFPTNRSKESLTIDVILMAKEQ